MCCWIDCTRCAYALSTLAILMHTQLPNICTAAARWREIFGNTYDCTSAIFTLPVVSVFWYDGVWAAIECASASVWCLRWCLHAASARPCLCVYSGIAFAARIQPCIQTWFSWWFSIALRRVHHTEHIFRFLFLHIFFFFYFYLFDDLGEPADTQNRPIVRQIDQRRVRHTAYAYMGHISRIKIFSCIF